MSTILEKPIILDETGQEIIDALVGIKNAISSGTPAGDPVRITVVTPPTKTHYAMSDTLDMSGITVSAIFSNNYMFDVTEQCTFSPASGSSFSEWGVVPITISWTWHNTGQTFTTTQEVEVEPQIVSFSNGTDTEIKAMLDAHYQDLIDISDYWSVGDTRVIHFNEMAHPYRSDQTWSAQDITIAIIGIDHTDLDTPINGHNKAAITVQPREVMGVVFIDNDNVADTVFTKWSETHLRSYINNTVFGAFASNAIKSAIKVTKHNRLTSNGNNPVDADTQDGSHTDRTTEVVSDKLFLPSYTEVLGNVTSIWYLGGGVPNSEEGSQFEYFTVSSNLIKYGNNNGVPDSNAEEWWIGSPSSDITEDGYLWGGIYDDGSFIPHGGVGAFYHLAPAWAM